MTEGDLDTEGRSEGQKKPPPGRRLGQCRRYRRGELDFAGITGIDRVDTVLAYPALYHPAEVHPPALGLPNQDVQP